MEDSIMQWENEGGSIAPEHDWTTYKPALEPVDVPNMLAEWQLGKLNEHDTICLFQFLVDSRLAFSLPYRITREAETLIRQGKVNTAFHPLASGISDAYVLGGGE